MELPSIGKHCGVSTCLQLDFLPFTCDACKRVFCHEHRDCATHSCEEAYSKDFRTPQCPLCGVLIPASRGEDPNIKMEQHISSGCIPPEDGKGKTYSNQCSQKGCKKREVMPLICSACKRNYCLKHRHQNDHECMPASNAASAAAASAQARQAKASHAAPPRAAATAFSSAKPAQQPRQQQQQQPSLRQLGKDLDAARAARRTDFVPASYDEDEALAKALAESQAQPQQAQKGGKTKAPKTRQEEEEELQRALEASRRSAPQQQQKGGSDCVIT